MKTAANDAEFMKIQFEATAASDSFWFYSLASWVFRRFRKDSMRQQKETIHNNGSVVVELLFAIYFLLKFDTMAAFGCKPTRSKKAVFNLILVKS